MDYFDDPVPDGAVVYTGDVPFQYNKQEGRYTGFSSNAIGNIFVTTSRDHAFLLSHKGNM